jgi:hypothetical protein
MRLKVTIASEAGDFFTRFCCRVLPVFDVQKENQKLNFTRGLWVSLEFISFEN